MIEPGDSTKTPRTVTNVDIPCSAWRHPLALTAAALAGALVFAILRVAVINEAGDEPPIRVRNGSLDLWLVNVSEKWMPNGAHWKITGGKRSRDDYKIQVIYNSGAVCTGGTAPGTPLEATGAPLEIVYYVDSSTTKKVTLAVQGKHTQVDSDAPLEILFNGKLLTYRPGTGYIQSISLSDGNVCTFTANRAPPMSRRRQFIISRSSDRD
jgi:hypothetical protein